MEEPWKHGSPEVNYNSAIHKAAGLPATGRNALQRLFSHSRLKGFFSIPQEVYQANLLTFPLYYTPSHWRPELSRKSVLTAGLPFTACGHFFRSTGMVSVQVGGLVNTTVRQINNLICRLTGPYFFPMPAIVI